ncbi:hypothetical protein G9A89_004323 [Geosiphon pyriformis]|nr:hypothetical protein G9A89_004323 [Geosiphon pyriformis]
MQELQLSGNGQHTRVPATCGHFKVSSREEPLIKLEEEKKLIWKAFQVSWANADHNNDKEKKKEEELTWKPNLEAWNKDKLSKSTANTNSAHIPYSMPPQTEYCQPKLVCVSCGKKLLTIGTCCSKDKEWTTATEYYCHPCIFESCGETLLDEGMWKDNSGRGRGTPINDIWKRALRHLEKYLHDEDEIWRMAYAMSKGATTEELREIKDNPLSLPEPEYVQTFDVFDNVEDDPKKFHEHYQRLALTREEQEERLCELIYNPPPRIIYMIPEKKEPISSCTSELESPLDSDSNSNNDDNNNGLSSIQNGNNNNNDSNSDPNFDTNYEQYIALPDLSKEQELK